jgi:hypothetical protein
VTSPTGTARLTTVYAYYEFARATAVIGKDDINLIISVALMMVNIILKKYLF